MTDTADLQQHVLKLERELDEMTAALSQAWDQLVPFLQEGPTRVETAQEIGPVLSTVAAAADADMACIYLIQGDEWYSVPDDIVLTPDCFARMAQVSHEQTLAVTTSAGHRLCGAFSPVMSENRRIGVLGIGSYDTDHVFTAVDLRIVARMAERIGSLITAAQLAHFREREILRAREMQIAREIQQSIQPDRPPHISGLEIAGYWQPARAVGGDTWGWVQPRAGRLAWFVLDVAGKGLPAALAAVALHTAITMALRMRLAPADVLRTVNTHFYDAYTRTDLMATAAVLALDPARGALEIANAGHPPILVRQQHAWLRLNATAPPIGVLPALKPESQFLMLKPNDLIVCYSDGFTEIQTQARLWGQTGLLNTIPQGATNVTALIEHITAAAQHAGPIEDDQTLVAAVLTDEAT